MANWQSLTNLVFREILNSKHHGSKLAAVKFVDGWLEAGVLFNNLDVIDKLPEAEQIELLYNCQNTFENKVASPAQLDCLARHKFNTTTLQGLQIEVLEYYLFDGYDSLKTIRYPPVFSYSNHRSYFYDSWFENRYRIELHARYSQWNQPQANQPSVQQSRARQSIQALLNSIAELRSHAHDKTTIRKLSHIYWQCGSANWDAALARIKSDLSHDNPVIAEEATWLLCSHIRQIWPREKAKAGEFVDGERSAGGLAFVYGNELAEALNFNRRDCIQFLKNAIKLATPRLVKQIRRSENSLPDWEVSFADLALVGFGAEGLEALNDLLRQRLKKRELTALPNVSEYVLSKSYHKIGRTDQVAARKFLHAWRRFRKLWLQQRLLIDKLDTVRRQRSDSQQFHCLSDLVCSFDSGHSFPELTQMSIQCHDIFEGNAGGAYEYRYYRPERAGYVFQIDAIHQIFKALVFSHCFGANSEPWNSLVLLNFEQQLLSLRANVHHPLLAYFYYFVTQDAAFLRDNENCSKKSAMFLSSFDHCLTKIQMGQQLSRFDQNKFHQLTNAELFEKGDLPLIAKQIDAYLKIVEHMTSLRSNQRLDLIEIIESRIYQEKSIDAESPFYDRLKPIYDRCQLKIRQLRAALNKPLLGAK